MGLTHIFGKRLAVLGLGWLTLAVSCSFEEGPSPVAVGPPSATYDTSSPAFQEALTRMPPFQREIIADGEITWAEVEKAYLAMVSCIEERGVRVVMYRIEPDDRYVGMGGYRDQAENDAAQPEIQAAYTECEAEYYMQVGGMYRPETPPPEDPYPEELSRQVAACMEEKGMVVDPVPVGWYEWQPALDAAGGDEVWMLFRACESYVRSGGPKP